MAVLAVTLLSLTRTYAASTIQFAVSTTTAVEGAGSVALDVRRQDDLDATVGVDFATVDGTALAGLKYVSLSGALTFAAGETNKTISVSILNEGIVGSTQDFQVVLSNPTGGAMLGARATATVRITDNDRGLQFEFGSYSVAEDAGFVLIGVTRGDDGNFPVTADYATADGTAKSGVDYMGVTNTLSFAAGETVKLFTVPILNDALKEPNKGFRLMLSNPAGGAVLSTPKTVTVTILDNDPGVQFEVSNYWVGEDEGSLTLNVLRGRDADTDPFTVEYATAQGTALASQDYIETQGTLTFAVGERSHQITVPVLRSESSTADRQFRLTLSDPSTGAGLGTNRTATVTVLDTAGMRAHRISGISVQLGHNVVLSFEGGVHKRFKDYFDLYPIEVSTDLATWIPWAILQRTNASTNVFAFTYLSGNVFDKAFYRTPAPHLTTPFRKPTGPFSSGVTSRLVTDPSRRNRYGISTNGSFMVSVWYPVSRGGDTELYDRFVYPVGLDADAQMPVNRSFVTFAQSDAPCATDQPAFPVIIHSPGWTGFRLSRSELGPHLASYGYIVIAVDHFDAAWSMFPDGALRFGDVTDAGFSKVGFVDRVNDIKLLIEQLPQWNSRDPALAGRLDPTKIALLGASWGGGVAGEVARFDEKVKAVVLLDAYLQNADELAKAGLSKPFIGMYSTEGGGELTLYGHKAAGTSIWFMINPSQHTQITRDLYWLTYPNDLKGGKEISRTVQDWTLWFLNKHVKGLDEPIPALKDYPRITGFKQK